MLKSSGGITAYASHSEWHGTHEQQLGEKFQKYGSEIALSDALEVNNHLDLFLKNTILPLAKQTNALILVAGEDNCTLAAALERVLLPEQMRLGDRCPFTVVAFVFAREVYVKSTSSATPPTLAAHRQHPVPHG